MLFQKTKDKMKTQVIIYACDSFFISGFIGWLLDNNIMLPTNQPQYAELFNIYVFEVVNSRN